MEMTGAQILMETLLEQGTDVIFGYPGGTVLDLYEQIYRNEGRIRHVLPSHEQGGDSCGGWICQSNRQNVPVFIAAAV